MYRSPERRNEPLFCKGSSTTYLLPCLCMTDGVGGTTVEIPWTHTRARRRGLGRTLVQKLGVTGINRALEGSEPFWAACGLPHE